MTKHDFEFIESQMDIESQVWIDLCAKKKTYQKLSYLKQKDIKQKVFAGLDKLNREGRKCAWQLLLNIDT